MCSCGGEMVGWCFDCGDYACDDCGCPNAAWFREQVAAAGGWDEYVRQQSRPFRIAPRRAETYSTTCGGARNA